MLLRLWLHTLQVGIAVVDGGINGPNGIEVKANKRGLLFHLRIRQADRFSHIFSRYSYWGSDVQIIATTNRIKRITKIPCNTSNIGVIYTIKVVNTSCIITVGH